MWVIWPLPKGERTIRDRFVFWLEMKAYVQQTKLAQWRWVTNSLQWKLESFTWANIMRILWISSAKFHLWASGVSLLRPQWNEELHTKFKAFSNPEHATCYIGDKQYTWDISRKACSVPVDEIGARTIAKKEAIYLLLIIERAWSA